MIKDLLTNKSALERANIKGQEIAKIKAIPRTSRAKFDIECVSDIQAIEGGVQIFVRAWTRDGKKVGFGKDGSVEIERFRIFNPPIMVPDGTKRTVTSPIAGTNEVSNFKEDLKEAVLQVIEHNLDVIPKHGEDKIVVGKIGNTISTFYPSDDGSITGTENADWAIVHDALTGGFSATDGWTLARKLSGNYWIARYFLNFNTAAIPDTDTISAATISLFGRIKGGATNPRTLNIYNSTASDTLVNGDYDLAGTTAYATGILQSNINLDATNDWTFNATGLTNISKTGITKVVARDAEYDVANTPPSTENENTYVDFYTYDDTGTTYDPKLVVTHSGGAGSPAVLGEANFLLMGV